MTIPQRDPQTGASAGWRPWAFYGPVFVVAGALMGHWFPALVGRGTETVWRAPPVAPQIDSVERLAGMPSLAPVVDMVKGGVVRIITVQRQPAGGPRQPDDAGQDENEHGNHSLGQALGQVASRYLVPTDTVAALGFVCGSGFVVHEDGLIVTSRHVVEAPASIRVELPDHARPFEAELLGEDPVSDLAVLRLVDAPSGLQALSLGDSDAVRRGDLVMSLGNPFEFDQTLSVGWITYVGRHVPEAKIRVTNPYLQFSAPVNPGDSGAALFDMSGSVIGMTRRTLSEGRGISFAVPSKVIKALLETVQRGDARVRRGYLGVEFQKPRHPETLRGLVEEGGGAEVTAVFEGHPADTAGVQVGDVIFSFDGQSVADPAVLYDWIIESVPGTQTEMSVVRAGAVLVPLTIVVGEIDKNRSVD